MKTPKPILWILLIILGIHIVGIGVFYFKGAKDPGTVKRDDSGISNDKSAPHNDVPGENIKSAKGSNNPLLGSYYSYRHAVQGLLKEIPETADIRAGIVVNINNHQVLWAKNPREGYPIASMTKMMTMLLTAEAMSRNSKLIFDTPIKISLAASKVGGSQVWLDPRETLTLGELMKAVAVKSANDAAYQVAEFINDGDVDGFVGMMNRRARQLLMPNTAFVNPHGLKSNDGKNSISSAEGMARLAEQLLEHQQFTDMCGLKVVDFRDKNSRGHMILYNTNKLLGKYPGIDGLKTGYTRDAGFCITVTCLRKDKRMVAVVIGSPSSAKRNTLVSKLLNWAYLRDNELNDPTHFLNRDAKSFGNKIINDVSTGKKVPMPEVKPSSALQKHKQ
ncbi:MAG: D-alanyl-D-alanine carboxypeptidase [Victivallaceae bacterium]|nr:D-alanyl-D-alanine carboxypeptidase [Victivallaceae bacterium]